MADDILKTLIAEAYGEGPEGMRRVAETIINRAAIRGLTPEQVVRQPKQYTGLNNPGPDAKKAWNNPEALAAAQAAWELAQAPGDPTGGADHYYAPGTISQPYWAKSMTPKGEYGGHAFYSSRPLPPGELPQVATALSTVPTPPPMPQKRPDLVARSFAKLPNPSSSNLGDRIAMNPVQGGKQQAPMFDAAYDTRTGQMRLTQQPIDSQGMAVGTSKAPPPVPAQMSPQIAARRATDPALQAALNARYPAKLPTLAPPANIPRPVSASDLARGNSGISTIATIPTTAPQPDMTRLASLYAGGGPTRPMPAIPERLMPGEANPPALFGGLSPTQVAQIGVDLEGNTAPFPFQRPDFPQVATALDVKPMPPMPIPRPMIGVVPRQAPAPMPASARPSAPLRIVINGTSPMPRPMTPIAQYQSQNGGSAQQAYDAVNRAATERAIANSKNPDQARRLNERLGNV